MNGLSGASTIKTDVESALAAPDDRLTFMPDVEARYEAEIGPARRRHLITCGLVALALYNLFLLSDWRLVPDIFETAVVVRLGIVTPISLLVVVSLLYRPPAFVREGTQACISVIVTASVLYLTMLSESPLKGYHHFGIVLVILFANIVQRLHFRHAVAATAGILALYVAVVVLLDDFPAEAKITAVMIMAGAAVFTLIANYALERQFRRSYLLSLLDRIRHEELDALAQVDPLTGLGNRRCLDSVLDQLWLPTVGPRETVSIVLLDVDHFKAYNDTYGHPAGDLCLKRIAAVLRGELEGTPHEAFRFGGEEFLLVLRGAQTMDGVALANRIRRTVEDAAMPHESSRVKSVVTVSGGVAGAIPHSTVTREEVILSADTALYAAKRAGRNQVWPPRGATEASVTSMHVYRTA